MKIFAGSGNVFADLGLPNAEQLKRLADKFSLDPNGAELFRAAARKLRERPGD